MFRKLFNRTATVDSIQAVFTDMIRRLHTCLAKALAMTAGRSFDQYAFWLQHTLRPPLSYKERRVSFWSH